MERSDSLFISNKNVYLMNGSKKCEPSGYFLNKIINFLKLNSYNILDNPYDCDTILINTCCVTKTKIKESEGLIEEAMQYSHVKRIIFFGCSTAVIDRYKDFKKVVYIGSKELKKFNSFFEHKIPIERAGKHVLDKDLFSPYQSEITNKDYYILISQGCVHNCSYCNIKKAKGNISSKGTNKIISEVKEGVDRGFSEFVLLADDCGSYGQDIGTNLAELVMTMLSINKNIKLKISTLFPGNFIQLYPLFREVIKTKRISYINIPIQSGSERILKLMNRNYDIPKLVDVVNDIKNISPETWLYTHVLINFPTEGKKDFLKSVKAASYFDEVMFISYSNNPQTRASEINPKVSKSEQERRIQLVRKLLKKDYKGIYVDENDMETDGKKEVAATKGVVQLSLTNRCQCNCKHCGVKYLNRRIREELSLKQINEIFKDIKLAGFGTVDLFGGEPTLRKDLLDIVILGKSYGFCMLLETNGIVLDLDYLKRLKRAGLDKIYLSLDDYTEEGHDTIRGQGVFKSAVRVLNHCKELGIGVHASIVPRNRKYFINRDMNKYIKFCLENGAEKIRILFPSYVGNCSLQKKIFCSEEDEKKLLKYIDREFEDVVYVESELSGLKSIINGKKIPCPAKSLFCHISADGLMMPCPYLPLVFGDATKESIIEIFSRIQEHPYMKQEGIYCPSRNKDYLKTHLGGIDEDNPFKFIRSLNKIDFQAKCNNNCESCKLISKKKTKEDILKEINNINKDYGSIHVYGGETFLHTDFFDILSKIPKHFKINLYTNGRIYSYLSAAVKLSKHNINSIKVPFFSLDKEKFEKHTKVKGSYEQTIKGIKNLCKKSIPVCVYVPKSEAKMDLDFLISLGVVSISTYEQAVSDPLPNSVLCFGRNIKKTSLIWIRK